jgi:hypothetical protein
MGINPGSVALLLHLARSGDLKRGDAILDIGASELYCADEPQRLNEFLAHFDAPTYSTVEAAKLADRSLAGGFFRRAGLRYDAIDFAGYPGVTRLDLNRDRLPDDLHGIYRIVMNFGTSEHILNQYNVFETIHDACAVGGIMHHGVPGWGDYQHGIISYSPKFFWALAKANDYEIIRYWGYAAPECRPLDPEFSAQIQFNSIPSANLVWLHILLRKRHPGNFAGLIDPSCEDLPNLSQPPYTPPHEEGKRDAGRPRG